MMIQKSSSLVGLLSLAVAGCAALPGDADIDGDELQGQAASEVVRTDVSLFYTVRPDARRCISPVCGGVWVRRVNYSTTRCADGRWRNECYAAQADFSALGLTDDALAAFREATLAGHAVVRGRLLAETYGTYGNLGRFVAQEGWQALTDAAPSGTFSRVHDNGIRCFAAPCFSQAQLRLNSTRESTLSALDVSGIAGLTDEQNGLLSAELGTDHGVIFAGPTRTVPNAGPAGSGRTLVATQAYLRVSAGVPDGSFCNAPSECTRTVYGTAPGSSAECYCPMCPSTIVDTVTAAASTRAFRRYCSTDGCAVPRCAYPVPVTCVNHGCTVAAPVGS